MLALLPSQQHYHVSETLQKAIAVSSLHGEGDEQKTEGLYSQITKNVISMKKCFSTSFSDLLPFYTINDCKMWRLF